MINLIIDLRERYNVDSHIIMSNVVDGDLHLECEKNNIPYRICSWKAWVIPKEKKFKLLRGLKAYCFNRKNILSLKKELSNEKYNIVFSNNSVIQIGAEISKLLNIPHIWHIREYAREHYDIQFSYPMNLVRKYFSDANKLIAVSKDLANYTNEKYSKNDNAICIYDGINIELPHRTHWNTDSILQICYVGTLQEGKNQIELLKAAKMLLSMNETNFHISFIGSGDVYESVLKEYVEKHKLEKYVSFLGFINNVPDILLNHMDIGVICSRFEAFGRVTVEYMMASMPVVGARGAGTSEIVKEGETGLLYTSGNELELAEFIKRLINDRGLIKKMGVKGYERAYDLFTSRNNTDSIYRIINQYKLRNN